MPDVPPPETEPCPFCLEPVQPAASVCPHCRSALAPVQALAVRLAVAEAEVIRLQALVPAAAPDPIAAEAVPEVAPPIAPLPAERHSFRWAEMAENLFLGLATLAGVQLLLITLPPMPINAYRAIALVIAVPFGLRFERYARSHLSGQVLAAILFGGVGIGLILGIDTLFDIYLEGVRSAAEWSKGALAFGLGHLTGSVVGRWWQDHRERQAQRASSDVVSRADLLALLRDPERLKKEIERYRTLVEAGAPIATAIAAAWASFGR